MRNQPNLFGWDDPLPITKMKVLKPEPGTYPQEMGDHKTLMIGGIYRDDNDDPDYDGCYALCMGNNAFYFIFNGIDHIENIVELACAHKMRKVAGYALALIKQPDGQYEWQIRNSGIKGSDKYILQKGKAEPSFHDSLSKFRKVFMK